MLYKVTDMMLAAGVWFAMASMYSVYAASTIGLDANNEQNYSLEGAGMFGSKVTSARTMLSYLQEIPTLNVLPPEHMYATIEDARDDYMVIDAFVAKLHEIENLATAVSSLSPGDAALVAAANEVIASAGRTKAEAFSMLVESQRLVRLRSVLETARKRNYAGEYDEAFRSVRALENFIQNSIRSDFERSGLEDVSRWEELDSVKMLRAMWASFRGTLREAIDMATEFKDLEGQETQGQAVYLKDGLAGLSVITQRFFGARLTVKAADFSPTEYDFEVLVVKSGEVRGVIYLRADPEAALQSSGVIRSTVAGRPGAAYVTVRAVRQAVRWAPSSDFLLRLHRIYVSEESFIRITRLLSNAMTNFLPEVGLETLHWRYSGVVVPTVLTSLMSLFADDWVGAYIRRKSFSSANVVYEWRGTIGLLYAGAQSISSMLRRNRKDYLAPRVDYLAVLGADPSDSWFPAFAATTSFARTQLEMFEGMKESDVREWIAGVTLAAMIHSHGQYRQKIRDFQDKMNNDFCREKTDDLTDTSFPSRLPLLEDESGLRMLVKAAVADPIRTVLSVVPAFGSRLCPSDARRHANPPSALCVPLEKALDFVAYMEEVTSSLSRERAALMHLWRTQNGGNPELVFSNLNA